MSKTTSHCLAWQFMVITGRSLHLLTTNSPTFIGKLSAHQLTASKAFQTCEIVLHFFLKAFQAYLLLVRVFSYKHLSFSNPKQSWILTRDAFYCFGDYGCVVMGKNALLSTIKFKLILNDLLTWEVLHADTSKWSYSPRVTLFEQCSWKMESCDEAASTHPTKVPRLFICMYALIFLPMFWS